MTEIKKLQQGSRVNKTIAPLYIKIVFIKHKRRMNRNGMEKQAAHLGQNDGR